MKIGAIVQARLSSTRLPRKVLKKLPYGGDITVLEQILRRLKRAKKLNDIIVAITSEKEDNELVNIIKKENIKCFRGDKENVLSRYYLTSKENNLDVVVRVTGDCPCIDPEIVNLTIEEHLESKGDYTSNSLERTYPHGLDVEVFNFDVLEKAYKNSSKDYEKEHVTPYIYRNPDMFKIVQVRAPRELHAPEIRITLDTEEDYALLCTIFDYLYSENNFFAACDIIRIFKEKPWLKLINKKIVQKRILENLPEEIKEAIKILDLQDLKKARDLLKNYLK